MRTSKLTKTGRGNSTLAKILMLCLSTPLYRVKWISKWFKSVYGLPSNTVIGQHFKCSAPLLDVEDGVILGYGLFIIAYSPIKIGKGTMFSFNNTIITSSHDFKDRNIITTNPVVIGRNVWITSNVTILPGVTIGDGSIIGAGSVVTSDIPKGVLAAGNPAKVIKIIDYDKSDC